MFSLQQHLPVDTAPTRLRVFTAADVPLFMAYRSDAELARFQGWSPMSPAQAHEFVGGMAQVQAFAAGGWIQLAVAHTGTDSLLGDVGLFLDEQGKCGELGFTLSRSAQGQGHATRAVASALKLFFDCTPVDEVRAVADVRNAASISLLERAGFQRRAVQQAQYKGETCTELVYVALRGMQPAAKRPG